MCRKNPMRASGNPAPQEVWDSHELVIVDPDEVAGLVVGGHDLGEALVDALVDVEIGQPERNLVQEVMEEGPDDAVADAFVVLRYLVGAQGDGYDAERVETCLEPRLLVRGRFRGRPPRPADPEPTGLLVGPGEACGQAAGAAIDLHDAVLDADRHRRAVRDDQEARHRKSLPRELAECRVGPDEREHVTLAAHVVRQGRDLSNANRISPGPNSCDTG